MKSLHSATISPDAPRTKERGTILVRGYGMPSLTLNETIKGMERFFLDTARQADLLRSVPRYNLLPEAQRDEAIRLTTDSACGILNFPKPVRPCRSLCPSQAGDNRGVFCFCHQGTSSGVGYILAEQRPGVREAPAVSLDRGALFRLFVSNSQTSEVHHV